MEILNISIVGTKIIIHYLDKSDNEKTYETQADILEDFAKQNDERREYFKREWVECEGGDGYFTSYFDFDNWLENEKDSIINFVKEKI